MSGDWGKIEEVVGKIRDQSVASFLNEELKKASSEGKAEIARYLLSVGADPNAKEYYGVTPLLMASIYGCLETVKILCDAGARILPAEVVRESPMSSVIGFLSVPPEEEALIGVLLFLEKRARAEARDMEDRAEERRINETAALRAELEETRERARITLENALAEKYEALSGDFGVLSGMLYEDARRLDSSRIETIARLNPNVVGARYHEGNSLLHFLAGRSEKDVEGKIDEMAETLIRLGADVSAVNEQGYSPLHLAANRGWRAGLVRILIAAGADVEIRDALGFAPIDYIRTRGVREAYDEALAVREARKTSLGGSSPDDSSEGGLTD